MKIYFFFLQNISQWVKAKKNIFSDCSLSNVSYYDNMNHDTMAETKWRWKFSLIYWDHFLCFFIILHTGRIDYGTFQQRLVNAWGWISSDIRLAVIEHLTVLVNSWISKCHCCTHCPNQKWFCKKPFHR